MDYTRKWTIHVSGLNTYRRTHHRWLVAHHRVHARTEFVILPDWILGPMHTGVASNSTRLQIPQGCKSHKVANPARSDLAARGSHTAQARPGSAGIVRPAANYRPTPPCSSPLANVPDGRGGDTQPAIDEDERGCSGRWQQVRAACEGSKRGCSGRWQQVRAACEGSG